MRAYRLLKAMPGLDAGAVFVHDLQDAINGSPALGCMKLAWVSGDCQQSWCGHTFILPGQLADNGEWFVEIDNPAPQPTERYY